MSARQPERWTPGAVRALSVITDVPTAAKVLGISRATAYELARQDQLPCRVLRCGKRLVIPTAGLLRALGLPDST